MTETTPPPPIRAEGPLPPPTGIDWAAETHAVCVLDGVGKLKAIEDAPGSYVRVSSNGEAAAERATG